MKFINLLFITILLSACSSTPDRTANTQADNSPGTALRQVSDEERDRYQNAVKLLSENRLEQAEKIFFEFTQTRPALAGSYANLAIINLKKGHSEKAEELVKIAVERNPELPQALNLLAYFEQSKGKVKEAEKHYLQAIESKKDYTLAYYNLALLYDIYLQDIDKAIPYYQKYLIMTNHKDKKTADWLEQLMNQRKGG